MLTPCTPLSAARWLMLLLCTLLLPACIPHTDSIPLSRLGLRADTQYGFEREMVVSRWQNHGEPNISADWYVQAVYHNDPPDAKSNEYRTLSPDARFQPERAYIYNFISSHSTHIRGTLIEDGRTTEEVLLANYVNEYLYTPEPVQPPPNQPGPLRFDRTTIVLPAEPVGCGDRNNSQAIFRFTNVSDQPVTPVVYCRNERATLKPVPPGGRGAIYIDLPSTMAPPVAIDTVRVETGNPQENRELIVDLRHHDWYKPPEKR